MSKQQVSFKDEGVIDFASAWKKQTELNRELIQDKRSAESGIGVKPHYLLFCEHAPVYTLGKSGSEENLKIGKGQLEGVDASFVKINRGGDITFHGPGQIVGYPILDLERFFTDVHKYVRSIEEVIIGALAEFDIEGKRVEGYTGVWTGVEGEKGRKLCAIGVHLSRWVTMHGFALNVNTDLSYFDNIIPCGIDDANKSVTSISRELGREIDMNEVKEVIKKNFARVFEVDFT